MSSSLEYEQFIMIHGISTDLQSLLKVNLNIVKLIGKRGHELNIKDKASHIVSANRSAAWGIYRYKGMYRSIVPVNTLLCANTGPILASIDPVLASTVA